MRSETCLECLKIIRHCRAKKPPILFPKVSVFDSGLATRYIIALDTLKFLVAVSSELWWQNVIFGRSGECVYVPNLLLFSFPILEFRCMHDDGVTSYSDQVHRKAFLAVRQPGSPFCLEVPHGSSRKGGDENEHSFRIGPIA
jgi:hypothetical protein